MRMGVVALTYNPGTAGGIETYFLDLMNALQRLDKNNEYFIFLNPAAAKQFSVISKNFKVISVTDSLTSKISRKLKLNSLVKQLGTVGRIDSYRCDVLHFPFQVIMPNGLKSSKILSFMDMQQEFYPQFFSSEDLAARRASYRSSCTEADQIIAISNHTKETLVQKYEIPSEKISVIYLAFNSNLYKKPKNKIEEPPNPYFYYPAATWPHKNHERLLEAFSKFKRKHEDYKLILSGIKKQKADEVEQIIKSLDLSRSVELLGYLPYDKLPKLYQQAQALVFPSLFEGFGIPLLEAMASGCPVTASNVTSIPEVAGKAALYFDPLDPDDIAEKMEEIAFNTNLRKKLVVEGYNQAKRFSDDRMAKETLSLYKKVAKK
jgi:glycosyltransferase involved in cell wall biosynthesis